MGILTINDMEDLIDAGVGVPEDGVDDPDLVKLYKKKNTLLFMALQEFFLYLFLCNFLQILPVN